MLMHNIHKKALNSPLLSDTDTEHFVKKKKRYTNIVRKISINLIGCMLLQDLTTEAIEKLKRKGSYKIKLSLLSKMPRIERVCSIKGFMCP